MTYFNNNNSYYSTSSTPEELGSYPFPGCQTLVTTGEVYRKVTPTSANDWSTVDQLGPTASPLADLLTGVNYSERLSLSSLFNPNLRMSPWAQFPPQLVYTRPCLTGHIGP